jgi:hypothetical protein
VTKQFNNIAGTTSNQFTLGQGSGNEVRQVVLNATGTGLALDRSGNQIAVTGVEFYDAKVLARNASGGIVAKQIRGTINGTTVTRIEDVFQEDFAADVTLTSNGTTLSANCTGTGNFTIYITLTKVAE